MSHGIFVVVPAVPGMPSRLAVITKERLRLQWLTACTIKYIGQYSPEDISQLLCTHFTTTPTDRVTHIVVILECVSLPLSSLLSSLLPAVLWTRRREQLDCQEAELLRRVRAVRQ